MGVKINKILTTSDGRTLAEGAVVCSKPIPSPASKVLLFGLFIATNEVNALAHKWIDNFVVEFDQSFRKEFSKNDYLLLTQAQMEQEVLNFIKDNNTGGIVEADLSIVDTVPNDA